MEAYNRTVEVNGGQSSEVNFQFQFSVNLD